MNIFLFFFISINLLIQQKDALKILNEIKYKYEQVNDYEVDAEIKFNITSIKVPEAKIKILFKKPNKVKILSENFAIIPKQGINFTPVGFFNENFTPVYLRTEQHNSTKYDVIKIIPVSDTSEILLSTLWIDLEKKVVKKIETFNKRTGIIKIELDYEKEFFGLPSKVKFTFGNEKVITENNQSKRFNRKYISGTVTIIYSNYKINKGLSDNVFMNNK